MLGSDPARTAQRVRDLSRYLGSNVMSPGCHDPAGFVCASFEQCHTAAASQTADFHAGQMSHIGEHYDLNDDGHELRIVVVDQENGSDAQYVDLTDRRQQILTASGRNLRYSSAEGTTRNPHMRGTTSALRILFGVEDQSDHASEFLELASGERVHMFDAFALVNVLLCSAHEKGTKRGRSNAAMRKNCLRHFEETLRVLEPNVLLVQGLDAWDWIKGIFDGPGDRVVENLTRMSLHGRQVYVATFTHPSVPDRRQWGRGDAPPYLTETVEPVLKRARAELRNDREWLIPMLRFVGRFDAPESAGHWAGGDLVAPNTRSMPFFSLSEDAAAFEQACNEYGWVLGQDWGPWADEARDLAEHPARFESADIDLIARCLTVYIRVDRFSEGALAHCYETGAIAAILRRMKSLADALA